MYKTRARVYSCTRVISRIIKVSRPLPVRRRRGVEKRERKEGWDGGRESGALFFFFSSGRCFRTRAHAVRTRTRRVQRARSQRGLTHAGTQILHSRAIAAAAAELIGMVVWVRVIAGNQARCYQPLPVHVSAPASTFLLLQVHAPQRTRWRCREKREFFDGRERSPLQNAACFKPCVEVVSILSLFARCRWSRSVTIKCT